MRAWKSLNALCFTCLMATGAAAELPVPQGAKRLDGLAAVVESGANGGDSMVILRSDVEFRARLGLTGETGSPVLGPLPQSLLGASLDELIGEALIAREAARLGLDSPSQARVHTQRMALAQMAGGEALLAQLCNAVGVGQREVHEIARRRAIVEGFLQTNLVGTTDITTAELDRVYEMGTHPFQGHTLEEIREPLRQWIGRERTRCAVKRWVAGLRARAEIRLLVAYANEQPGADAERCNVMVGAAPAVPVGSQETAEPDVPNAGPLTTDPSLGPDPALSPTPGLNQTPTWTPDQASQPDP